MDRTGLHSVLWFVLIPRSLLVKYADPSDGHSSFEQMKEDGLCSGIFYFFKYSEPIYLGSKLLPYLQLLYLLPLITRSNKFGPESFY